MRSIAVQRRRPGGRRQPIADAAVAAIVAVGGLVLAGTATAGPDGARSAAPEAAVTTDAAGAAEAAVGTAPDGTAPGVGPNGPGGSAA